MCKNESVPHFLKSWERKNHGTKPFRKSLDPAHAVANTGFFDQRDAQYRFCRYFCLSRLEGAAGKFPISLEAPAPVLSTNQEVLEKYSQLSQEELFLHLENDEPLEEGLTRRDLALASLSAFHHFHVDRALGWAPLQKRALSFSHLDEAMTIPVFAGLGSEQFNAILHYAKTEKWPLTPRGLFFEIQRSFPKKDPALWGAFFFNSGVPSDRDAPDEDGGEWDDGRNRRFNRGRGLAAIE